MYNSLNLSQYSFSFYVIIQMISCSFCKKIKHLLFLFSYYVDLLQGLCALNRTPSFYFDLMSGKRSAEACIHRLEFTGGVSEIYAAKPMAVSSGKKRPHDQGIWRHYTCHKSRRQILYTLYPCNLSCKIHSCLKACDRYHQ